MLSVASTKLLFCLGIVALCTCAEILKPELIAAHQFTETINGIPMAYMPSEVKTSADGQLIEETYEVTMKSALLNLLPLSLKLPMTKMYVYGGQTANGEVFSFPGPAFMVKQGVPIKVIWKNNIAGKHILPVDFSEPFNSSDLFKN